MDRRNIQEIKTNNFRLINISHLGKSEAEYLRKNFGFEALDVEMCLPPLQRPNVFSRENYLFAILLFPYYDRKMRAIRSAEVDFFITRDTLVVVHSNELAPLIKFFDRAKNIKNPPDFSDAGEALYKITDQLIKECFPMLAHISNDIDEIEQKLLRAPERGTIGEILRIKTNIVNFQKTAQGHKAVIRKLMTQGDGLLKIKDLEIQFNYLVEETKEIWEALDSYKSTIDALHEANDSLISYRTSDIMRTLTVFSVIIFVSTLIVSLFNLPVIDSPLAETEHGFKIVLGVIAAAVIGLLIFFKKKKWF